MQNNTVVQAQAYPFTSGNGVVSPCQLGNIKNATAPFAKTVPYPQPFSLVVGGYPTTPATNDQIKSALMINPVAVYINADGFNWRQYNGGIMTQNCLSTKLDHGLLAVGWGTSLGKSYWIAMNSWGT